MKRLVLGVIGHVDHGKTALVRALTGKETDRLPEEKRRGISIALGFAHLKVGADTVVDLIDMPGHERFVRTMISGATGIDAVLLVLAANEGIKAQTIEHVDIAGLLGIRRALIAISKTDLVSKEEARIVAGDAAALLRRAGLEPSPPIMTSALHGAGIDDLREALKGLAENQTHRAADGMAFLPIDRAFSVAGHGPVVTGTLRGAAISTGDTLEVSPSRTKVRVRTVQVHGERVSTAAPGQRVALNLRDIDIADLKRGVSLGAPDTLALSDWLTMSIRAVESAPPMKNGMQLRVLVGTDEFSARLRLLDREVLEPGQGGFAQLKCATPVAIPAGEHVILRQASPARTLAGGRVLEPETHRQKRNSPALLERLDDLSSLAPADLIMAEVARAGLAGVSLRRLSQLSALSNARIIELLQPRPFVLTQSGWAVRNADMDDVLARIPPLLAPHGDGLSHDGLMSSLPGISAAVLDEALDRLRGHGAVSKRGAQFLVPRPDEDNARSSSEATLAAQIGETLRRGGLSPPDPSAIVTDINAKRAVDRLLREGVVVRAVDRAKNKEILFHRDAIDQAQRVLAPMLERVPGLLVSEIGAALGISRKYSMPLVDHLDAIRFTQRIQDRRMLGARAPRVK